MEDKVYPTKRLDPELPSMPTETSRWWERLPKPSANKISAFCCSMLLVGAGALGMHAAYPLLHPVTYNEIKAHYIKLGNYFMAQKIEDMGKTCPDGGATLACYSLNEYKFPPEISQAMMRRIRK